MLVSGSEAAERLGVSVRQTQRLARSGLLTAVGTDRIEYASVLRLAAQRQDHHHRVWAEATAWAAVAILSGQEVTWLGQPQRSRLRRALRESSGRTLAARTRNRAVVQQYRAHRGAVPRLAAQVVSSLADQALGELTAQMDSSQSVDGYLAPDVADDLISRYQLVPDVQGNTTLRVTNMALDRVRCLASSEVLAALDLAGSPDERARSAAIAVLGTALERFRG